MMSGHASIIGYLTVGFLALAVAGLLVLRGQKAVGTRVIVFLLFCVVCVRLTVWVTKRWQLLMGETAIAWVIALVLAGVIFAVAQSTTRRARDP
jgi:hypothetical protein